MDAHFDVNLPSDYGWGPASRNGEHIVPFVHNGHNFYNGVRAEMANWFHHLCDAVIPLIPGGLYTAHATPSPDDGHWGYEYRQNRNASTSSVHSWGGCLDFNAVQNPNGSYPANGGRYVLGDDVSAVARAMGGLHGRTFSGTKDGMHIECKLDPGQLRAWDAAHPAGSRAPAAPNRPAAPARPASGGTFPLPAGFYYGPFSGPNESISGQGKADARYQGGLAAAQRKLNLASDGVYGDKTAAAVKRFQAAHGLTADGLIGPNTWRALGL